ncbi:MAG: hypothetical protein AAGN66_21325 [Acidobacteriota bacterium]
MSIADYQHALETRVDDPSLEACRRLREAPLESLNSLNELLDGWAPWN